MTGRFRLARETTVEACQALLEIEPLLVDVDTDLLEVVRRAASQPSTRLIGVTENGRVVGVVPISRVAESVVAHVAPEALFVDVEDEESALRFIGAVEDRTARDIMIPPATTTPTATLGQAFRVMHERRLGGLYVVDEAGRPTGYLDILELAVVYAGAIAAEAERRGHDPGPSGGSADPTA